MSGLMTAGDVRLQTPTGISFTAKDASGTSAQLHEKAEELEGVFLNTLMSQMFSSIDTGGTFGGGFAEKTWRSMQAEQFAQMVADNGGVGLADRITANLLSVQEWHRGPSVSPQLAQGAYRK